MQKILLAASVVLAGASVWLWYESLPQKSEPLDLRGRAEVYVVLEEDGYSPAHLRVSKGASVIFTTTTARHFWPASNLHPAHDIYSAFDPERPLAPEESWRFVFDRTGEWGFHDHIRSYYDGIIYVEA